LAADRNSRRLRLHPDPGLWACIPGCANASRLPRRHRGQSRPGWTRTVPHPAAPCWRRRCAGGRGVKAFSRSHLLLFAIAAAPILAFLDLQWLDTLRYRVALPDFFVYYLAAQMGQAHGWAAMYDPSLFLPAVTSAVGRPLPYLNPPSLAGIALAVVFLKPQAAFLVPVALLLAGYWRVFVSWLGVSALLTAIGLLVVGTSVFHHVMQSLADVQGIPGPVQISLGRQLPLPVALIGILLVLAVSVWVVRRARPGDSSIPIAVGLVAS